MSSVSIERTDLFVVYYISVTHRDFSPLHQHHKKLRNYVIFSHDVETVILFNMALYDQKASVMQVIEKLVIFSLVFHVYEEACYIFLVSG